MPTNERYSDVVVIIISFNTKDHTLQAIQSVLAQPVPPRTEIILVDNASLDGTANAVQEQFPQVSLIRNIVNEGFAKAANRGIRGSSSKYVMLLNSDARLKADGLARLFEFMEDSESRQYWACGGLLFQEDGSPQHSFFPWVSDVWGDMRMVLSRIYHAILTGKWYIDGCPRPKEKPLDVDHVTGAALFFRRQVNEQNLSFDEKFFMYSEDSELSFRMKQIGFRAAVLPSVRILHVRGSSSRTNDLFLLMRLMEVDSRFRLSRQSAGRVMEFIDRAIHGTYYLFSFLLRGGVLSRELLLLTLNVKKLDDRPDFQMLKQGIVPVGPMNSSVEP